MKVSEWMDFAASNKGNAIMVLLIDSAIKQGFSNESEVNLEQLNTVIENIDPLAVEFVEKFYG